MSRGILIYLVVTLFALIDALGQSASAPAPNWKPLRTPDGQPDLQGIWTNATLTPLQRPAELGDKQFFTQQEAAAYEKQRILQTDVDRIEGERGPAHLARRAYNSFWFDRGTHVVKRFTRTDPDTIIYSATITDPTVYTRPWTVEISMTRHAGPLLEYACNEGNYGMFGILSGARAEEGVGSQRQ